MFISWLNLVMMECAQILYSALREADAIGLVEVEVVQAQLLNRLS
jgi:hypothetical protein